MTSKNLGRQRDWIWRGWQIRYTYSRSRQNPPKTPLILLHGFGAAIAHWRHNIPVLSSDRHVYALDLLGFGASRKIAHTYTTTLWAEQIEDFWQTFIGEPVVLVGNSLGSLAAITLASRHPEMVKGLVLLNIPDVSLRQEAMPPLLQKLINPLENAIASPLLIKALFSFLQRRGTIRQWVKLAYQDPRSVDEELVDILTNPPQDEGAANTFYSLFKSLKQPHFSPPIRQVIAGLNLPILLMWGEEDRMVPFSLSQKFLGLNPQLQFNPLPGVGHCPHDECPDRFHQLLGSWLTTQIEAKTTVSLQDITSVV